METRINKTNKELDNATDLNLRIGKGAKLKVYKECLNYIKTHNEEMTEDFYCVSCDALVYDKPCEKWCGDINCKTLCK